MTIDFPIGLKPLFLTVEQVAQYLDITVDFVVRLIEEESLFAYAAIPAVPMILVPEGYEDDAYTMLSSSTISDSDWRRVLMTMAGTFSISREAVKSVAIKGSAWVDIVWTLTPHDKGYLDIKKDSPEWFGGDRFWLKNPIEITLSNIRVPFFLAKKHRELIDLDLQTKAIIANQCTENPLQESERRWPWGNHETELLRKLALAAERFWKLYDPNDPTTAPISEQVIEWLKQQGVADRTAEKMAQILRANGLPSGRRK